MTSHSPKTIKSLNLTRTSKKYSNDIDLRHKYLATYLGTGIQRGPAAVLSLHTALPVRSLPPHSRPVLCLPTSYILLSLQQKKTPISQIPEAVRSLARGRPKMADDGYHFDRRLHRVASPCAQSLTDVASYS